MTLTLTAPSSFDKMVSAMLSCEQFPGFSVYQHGVSVSKFFFDLISDSQSSQWKLPDWFIAHKQQLIQNLHSTEIITKYLLFHDCGKSESKTIDEHGKVHFPNHAEISKQIWLSVGGDPVVADLIGWDMDIHTFSSVQIDQRCRQDWTIQDACTLLLASLAEIHSNASIFGGMKSIEENLESISFKIKWKQLDRRGKLLCKYYFQRQSETGEPKET